MKLLLYGPPGAGKDTQGHVFAQQYGAAFVSAGRLLRAEMRTEEGQAIVPYVQAGEPVPSGIVCRIIERTLSRPEAKGGYIMNGFPRTLDTFEWYMRLDRPDAVVLLDVDEKVLRFRLELRARFDDIPGTITRRLAVYREHTPAILARFTDAGVPVLHIDGNPSVRHVSDAITTALTALGRHSRPSTASSHAH